jgi:NADH dehydrogenase
MSSIPSRHRVVIIGGGFGGVRAAKALGRAGADVVLIDRTNHHLFQPLLYQVATGVLSPGQIAPPLRSLFRGQDDVEVMLAAVEGIDLERRVVRAVSWENIEVPYDTLIVAGGATHSYFGHDEWAELAPGMKTLDDALRLRSRILGAFELAEQAEDEAERRAWLTFAIVGAGPTGVELAGQIALLAHRVLRGEYRHMDPASVRVILLDAAPAVLGTFPESLQRGAKRSLERLGVEVDLDRAVTAVDPSGVTLGDGETATRVTAQTVIWAAGVRASPLGGLLAEQTGAPTDRSGRLTVQPDLSLPGHPEVFAIGDKIAIPGVPGTAQPAIQEAKYVAHVVRARLDGRPAPRPFKYRDLGTMATIGRSQAVADLFGRIRLQGFPAFIIWGVVHLAYLVGWGNRVGAVTRWMWTILARNRRERLISLTSLISEDAAQQHLQALRDASR